MPTRVTHTINYYFNTYLASTNSSSSSRVPSPKEKSTLLSALGTQLSRFRHPHLLSTVHSATLSCCEAVFGPGKASIWAKRKHFPGASQRAVGKHPPKACFSVHFGSSLDQDKCPRAHPTTTTTIYILFLLLLSAKNYLLTYYYIIYYLVL